MKRVLVPTDFSTCALNAIDFAVQSAKQMSIQIILFHAFEAPKTGYTEYDGSSKLVNQAMLEEVGLSLQNLQKAIKEAEGITVQTHVAVTPFADAILEASALLEIDLIVMGTVGDNGLKEKIWGSKTAALIGKAKLPIMVIPFLYAWKHPQKILFVTDRFEKEMRTLDFMFTIVRLYKASLTVAVFTDEDDDDAFTFLEHKRTIVSYEELLKKMYQDQSLTVTDIVGKKFEEALQDYIDANNIDVLMMISYPHHFPDRIFHPSKTKKMSYHTTIPLLVIPANLL